ncbi:MAG: tetratricopeptide repeat protein [Deltaproteobacteria bacterium]|nr:MAG: tetratricopeptide repeat protein [Deltaproteobacteria bacterium]
MRHSEGNRLRAQRIRGKLPREDGCSRRGLGEDGQTRPHRDGRYQVRLRFFILVIFFLAVSCGKRVVVLHDPLSPEEHNDLGVALTREGDLKTALYHLEKAVSGAPDNPLFRYNLGNALFRFGRYSEAEDEYRKALKLKEVFPEALNNLCALSIMLNKNLSWCLEELSLLIRKNPDLPWEVYDTAGDVARALGKNDEARMFYEEAMHRCSPCPEEMRGEYERYLNRKEKGGK